MKKHIISLILKIILGSFFLSGCIQGESAGLTTMQLSTLTPSSTSTTAPTSSYTPTYTLTETPTPTLTGTPTPSPTSTPTSSPTASRTPQGGGSGTLRFSVGGRSVYYSLDDRVMSSGYQMPEFHVKYKTDENNVSKLIFHLGPGENRVLYECPLEDFICSIKIVAGNPGDEWIYINVEHRQQQFCPCTHELIKVNTITADREVLDQAAGWFRLMVYPGTSKWLMTTNWVRSFRSDLFVYNPETREKTLVVTETGSYNKFGYAPNQAFIWYRITDYCLVKLVREDGSKIPGFQGADSILGWIDKEHFLVVTARNNPPNCSLTGLAVANQHGLTGEWLLQGNYGSIVLSPDQTKLVYTDNCKSDSCKRLVIQDLDGGEPEILYETDMASIYSIAWIGE